MAFRDIYRRQVALLVRVLPHIAEESCFALKGGTAINLFIRDMPRLSVDIDLTYVPVAPRPESLTAIDVAMKRIAARAKKALPDAQITHPDRRAPSRNSSSGKAASRLRWRSPLSCVDVFMSRKRVPYPKPSKPRSASLRCQSYPLPTSMPARS